MQRRLILHIGRVLESVKRHGDPLMYVARSRPALPLVVCRASRRFSTSSLSLFIVSSWCADVRTCCRRIAADHVLINNPIANADLMVRVVVPVIPGFTNSEHAHHTVAKLGFLCVRVCVCVCARGRACVEGFSRQREGFPFRSSRLWRVRDPVSAVPDWPLRQFALDGLFPQPVASALPTARPKRVQAKSDAVTTYRWRRGDSCGSRYPDKRLRQQSDGRW